jgi:hypothetical protein
MLQIKGQNNLFVQSIFWHVVRITPSETQKQGFDMTCQSLVLHIPKLHLWFKKKKIYIYIYIQIASIITPQFYQHFPSPISPNHISRGRYTWIAVPRSQFSIGNKENKNIYPHACHKKSCTYTCWQIVSIQSCVTFIPCKWTVINNKYVYW